MTRSYSSLLTWLGLTIAASLMLFHTSDRVNELDHKLHELNAQIEAEQQSMHVLKAEWVYLANPARIEAEAQRHLGLQPTAPRHVASLRDMGDLLPMHNGVAPPAPILTADAAPAIVPLPAPAAPMHHERLASINSGHINDHMIMQHTAKADIATDKIGALIGTMGLHP